MKTTFYILMIFALFSCGSNKDKTANSDSLNVNELTGEIMPGKPDIDITKVQTTATFVPRFFNETRTAFGVLFHSFPEDRQVQLVKNFGLHYTRDGVSVKLYRSRFKLWTPFTDQGIRVLFNINYDVQGSRGTMPTDTVEYKKQIEKIIDSRKWNCEVAVIGNEATNRHYVANYNRDVLNLYLNSLRAAITVCHERGIKVTNSGDLFYPGLRNLVYRDYLARGSEDSAAIFASVANMSRHAKDLATASTGDYTNDEYQRQNDAIYLVDQYSRMDLDYINMHIYGKPGDPVGLVLPYIANYIRRATGKPVICNEAGQATLEDPQLIGEMMDGFVRGGFVYVTFFGSDGDDGWAIGFVSKDGSVRASGKLFIDKVKGFY